MHQIDWLKGRKLGIGGSDAAAICGVSSYLTPLDVYLDKTDPNYVTPEFSQMLLGKLVEPMIKQRFTEKTGVEIVSMSPNIQSPIHNFMLANLDGAIKGQRIIVECKAVFSPFVPLYTNVISDEHMLQCQHYMAVTGYEKAILLPAILINGEEPDFRDPIEIPRDQTIVDNLIKLEFEFWTEKIQSLTPPEIDFAHPKAAKLLANLYPTASESELELSPTLFGSIERVTQLKETIKILEKEQTAIESQLKSELKEASKGKCGKFTVLWKNFSANRLDIDRLKIEQFDIYQRYVRNSPYRRFEIKSKETAHVEHN